MPAAMPVAIRHKAGMGAEAYELSFAENAATIEASTRQGMFYGLVTLGQILRGEFGVLYPFPWLNVPKAAVKVVAPVIGLTREFVDTNVGYPLVFDASRSQSELGLVYRPIEQTVVDHFQQMLDDGIVRKRPSIRLP